MRSDKALLLAIEGEDWLLCTTAFLLTKCVRFGRNICSSFQFLARRAQAVRSISMRYCSAFKSCVAYSKVVVYMATEGWELSCSGAKIEVNESYNPARRVN